MMRLVLLIAAVLALAACGEKPQTGMGIKSDVPAFQGVSNSFSEPGWKSGDKTSWEEQLKTRAIYGQNDYSRIK